MPSVALPQVLLGLLSRLNVTLPGKVKTAALNFMVEENAAVRNIF
ncbi:hypothetical protein [Candidatus Proelusimicrobium excrementi]